MWSPVTDSASWPTSWPKKTIRELTCFARYAVRLIRRDELGFGEVVQTVNALSVAVLHQEHRARTVFRPREQEHVIGAEVEH